ncbi:hypothetical protein [Clostridium estertheticum]|uniref:hypothetical protein n=1 Tax=Clostridium estertheticum TaxID=238834 RepID=UPI001C0E7F8B|nr:hypothetical protein [Clostridium estertheticum]MBU3173310.1 hypothetical protein [Clostridium estertheticum]
MNNIIRQIVAENNLNTENELIALAKTKIKYRFFQTFLERKNTNNELPPFCDAVTIFYKGVDLIEIYPLEDDRLDEYDILNISGSARKKIMFDLYKNEIFFEGEHALEVLLDDVFYPPRTLKTRKDKFNVIYD